MTAEELCVAISEVCLLAFFVVTVAATIVGHRRGKRAGGRSTCGQVRHRRRRTR